MEREGKRERGGEVKEGRGEERRGEGRRVGQNLEEWSKKEDDKKKDLAAFYLAPLASSICLHSKVFLSK